MYSYIRTSSKVRKLPSDLDINLNLLQRYLDDKRITPSNKDKLRVVIDMYKARSSKSYATASNMAKLSSRYKGNVEKGLKLYSQVAKETFKIRCIFYRKQDHEINDPERRKNVLNRLLPDYKAY